jgi:hypothetical protein
MLPMVRWIALLDTFVLDLFLFRRYVFSYHDCTIYGSLKGYTKRSWNLNDIELAQ